MDKVITNGIPWFAQNQEIVNAHGACLLKKEDKYYLFGEYKTEEKNCFNGFSCYSSSNLSDWTFEKMALPVQKDGLLGEKRIGERPKVMYLSKEKQYVMYAHSDNLTYSDPVVTVAKSSNITGPYEVVGALLVNKKPLRRWDIGSFTEKDKNYLLTHEGNIYELSEDGLTGNVIVENLALGGESPALFKEGKNYFWLFSNKTSWERNDNYYFQSTSLTGPWINKGLFCPKNSLTYNSQCSFVFSEYRENETVHLYVGDRWSFPKQSLCSTQVWLPITVKQTTMSIPDYFLSWNFNSGKEILLSQGESLRFSSNKPGEKVSFSFSGERLFLFGKACVNGGYGKLRITSSKGEVFSYWLDFYALKEEEKLIFESPKLEKDDYQVDLMVTGEMSIWSDKHHDHFGSLDCEVNLISYEGN